MRSAADTLILFDVDATLISTGGVGFHAMVAAGRAVFGPGFSGEGVGFAGRLDPVILHDLLERHSIAPSQENLAAMRQAYHAHLRAHLAASGDRRVLPGVGALLAALDGTCTLGLLTGNFEETGSMKLRACGLDPERFQVRVWGDHSPRARPSRDDLPPVALRAFRARHGREPRRAVVVGDTPLDVACARANGLHSLAVATGQFPLKSLRDAGASHAVPDLSDTIAVARWLLADDSYTPGEGSRR